jgi:hypothetical protein
MNPEQLKSLIANMLFHYIEQRHAELDLLEQKLKLSERGIYEN